VSPRAPGLGKPTTKEVNRHARHDPQPRPPLDDVCVVAARKALAELPEAEDNERWYFWVGRLKVSLTALLAAWPPGARGGLDNGQREVGGSRAPSV
jgi:hypothetical protein